MKKIVLIITLALVSLTVVTFSLLPSKQQSFRATLDCTSEGLKKYSLNSENRNFEFCYQNDWLISPASQENNGGYISLYQEDLGDTMGAIQFQGYTYTSGSIIPSQRPEMTDTTFEANKELFQTRVKNIKQQQDTSVQHLVIVDNERYFATYSREISSGGPEPVSIIEWYIKSQVDPNKYYRFWMIYNDEDDNANVLEYSQALSSIVRTFRDY